MPAEMTPRLDMLEPAQRLLWNELIAVPPEFVLYGGTAIAIHLGHRVSLDFDFFRSTTFDPDLLYQALPFLKGAQVTQKNINPLSVRVDRGAFVKVSFFGVPGLPRIRDPLVVPQIRLRVAALIDLAATKAATVRKRAQAKDYVDLDALIQQPGIDLPLALAAAQQLYGPVFNPLITLKALSRFEDGDLPTLPGAARRRLLAAVRAVDLDRLPHIALSARSPEDRA